MLKWKEDLITGPAITVRMKHIFCAVDATVDSVKLMEQGMTLINLRDGINS